MAVSETKTGDVEDAVVSIKLLGKIGTTGKAPPVMVTLKDSLEARQMLKYSSHLNKLYMLRRVYVTPDMSKEEREMQKKLVEDLKKKIEDFPEERWIIRNGSVISKGKWVTRERLNSQDEGKNMDISFKF